ncbi:transglutaminase domain-containing protein [Dyella soli]|uniref:Transglutaminase domain-containing protein n=1 Tax=Dyella soli TaxID=522319 RepID=A0A4R0YLG5_9GAMM|nr:transglutaminase-like domain-containing protein [Dyella soli]TCI09576.1 transglutaminase domain-containing protein [Dyella soli]
MRKPIAPLLLVLALCLAVCALARAAALATDDSTWMTVLLDGRKIGYVHIRYQRDGDFVTTTQTLSIQFRRNGKDIPLSSMTRSVESATGQPLAFSARTTLSATDSTVAGQRQADGSFMVTTTVGGMSRQQALDWPGGAVLSEGQRLALVRANSHPGQRYELRMFDPASLRVARASMEVIGTEPVALPGGTATLVHQRQRLSSQRETQVVDLWLDERGQTRKGTLKLLGREMEMLACNQACALAPVQPTDMFRAALVNSPRAIRGALATSFLRYRLHVPEGEPSPAIDTDEQHVVTLGHGDWLVDIGAPRAGGEPPPRAEDSLPNAWLQSDTPLIRRLAGQAVGAAPDNLQKMQRLRRFVSDYVSPHGLDVGYASALEVATQRQGDCTEYAVLLAALARAQGIPARVVTGMVYSDRYAGRSHVFLPHAWVQAWVNGRWQSFDAARQGFDSTHLALDMGDGDPWHFFNATNLFGRLRIDDIRSTGQPASRAVP